MKKDRKILLLIFIISMGLRLTLGYLTREANDDHVSVVNWIADKHQLPGKNDCWECFQPKFYYILVTSMVDIFNLHTTDQRRLFMQFFNVFLGFFIILFFWKFIKKQNIADSAKLLWFSFFALNPCLAAINVQATNDTFEIFCGVLAVYYCDLFFRRTSIVNFCFMLIALLAAALSKETGFVLIVAIFIFFIVKIFSQGFIHKKFRLFLFLMIGIFSFTGIVIFAGGYYSYYSKYHELPSSTWAKNQPPQFIKETENDFRPGVKSIVSGFFTFRYFNMIKQPYITNEGDYPLHRTSLWSQLYGRTVFLQFDQWPSAWQTHAPVIVWTGRILIILGIIPLLIFLRGIIYGTTGFFRGIKNGGRQFLYENVEYLHLGITIAFLLASVKYCYDYRDFSAMKSLYIFPGFISYIKMFTDGYSSIKSVIITKFINIIVLVMIVFSIGSIGHLIYQLHYRF